MRSFFLSASLMVLAAGAVAEPLKLDLTLTPQVSAGAVTGWSVESRFDTTAGDPVMRFTIPKTLGPLQRIPDRLSHITAHDDKGLLNLTASDGTGYMGAPAQIFTTDRAPVGDVILSYDVATSQETISGPNWELRAEGPGSSAQGSSILLLPDQEKPYEVSIRWDLKQLPQGARSITSYARDPKAVTEPISRLRQTYFMAGNLISTPDDLTTPSVFRAASTAINNHPQKPLLDWSSDAYTRMSGYFGFSSPPPFTVLMRSNIYGGTSGTAGPEGLIATMAPQASELGIKSLISHEMVHVYLHGLMEADDSGRNPDAGWFTEGIAVYYQRRAPFMTGLFTPDQFLEDFNETARAYYSNIRINVAMSEAIKNFWTDPRQRIQPYNRGSMYFHVLDGQIRAKSGGERTLDDVVRAYLKRHNDGLSVTEKDWMDLLVAELGPQAKTEFEAMMNGAVQIPASNALGICFKRVETRMPVFELGFEMSSLINRPRVIAGLDPVSPAAKAGLKDGDVVTNTLIIDAIQDDPREPITLKIERDGQKHDITFSPQGRLTKGYLWQRVKGVSDKKCAV
ncbi:hypothetical protein [Asticcacaulis endophyticus]|uniref:Peptidase M61 catalytic domain-containing protein n=1 Tax=Asticcacaulis endophyticus TaxID=1395890 RepID=A0A918UYX7_9CAUL|nr:hypothetical protein [Asticcacaulis endophyticus]GGZ43528.1 hypothetical protein GCM10011273_32950 [Asticcacaulis endophyticus]